MSRICFICGTKKDNAKELAKHYDTEHKAEMQEAERKYVYHGTYYKVRER